MATPTAKKDAGHPGAPGGHPEPVAVEHHYTWAPLGIGVGLLFLYLGFEFVTWKGLPIFPVLGVLIFLASIGQWIREDVAFWARGYKDPGVLPGKHGLAWWGTMFFLGTEVMLFGGLFAVYFVGQAAHLDIWREGRTHLPFTATAINTVILVSSSFTLHFGEAALKKNKRNVFNAWLGVTLLLGAIFLALQVQEYRHLIAEGNVISKNAYWSIFYQLTGTHGAHVFLGLVFLSIVMVRSLLGQFDGKRHDAPQVFGIYWHFVDVVWVFLFLTIYVGVF